MRPELRLPSRDRDAERALAIELHAIEDLLLVDLTAALTRLNALAERTGHGWCDESLVWQFASNAEETLIALALPPAPRLGGALCRDDQLELVRAWWSASREGSDRWAETWFSRVLEANVVDPWKVRDATGPEDFLERALALPPPVRLPAPDGRGPLRDALASWLAADLSTDTLFAHVERTGPSLAELLDALTEIDDGADEGDEVWALLDHVEFGEHDVIAFFVEHLGVDRTQTITDESRTWHGLDVREHLARLDARRDAWAALEHAPITVAYARAIACDPHTRSTVVGRLASDRAMNELVALAEILEDHDVAAVRGALAPRAARQKVHGSPSPDDTSALVVEAIESSWMAIPPETVLEACARLFDIAPTADTPPLSLLQVWSDAAQHARHSLGSATTFAARHLASERWWPQLRTMGLRASSAALTAFEAGETTHVTARRLLDAGYSDDEVFSALRSNGVASLDTLAALRESGWVPARMVDVLALRGELPTEVRDRLHALGLADDEIRTLLGSRWDPDTVALVLPRER